jgi:hypothetical protein
MTRHPFGHDLDLRRIEDEVVAVCKCGKWQVTAPVPANGDVVTLVAHLLGEHDRHLDGVGRPMQDVASRR